MGIFSGIILTQTSTPVIGQIAWLMGKILEFIYNLGIHNIGVCIIILTCIVYLIMLPLTIQQQKFSKLSNIMQPEINAIQKKYKDKKDQASMMKQQDEIKAVYEKYGTSATGGCLNLFITMPLLFAFYRVVYNIPAYVGALKNIYISSGVIDAIMKAPKSVQSQFIELAKNRPILVSMDQITQNKAIDTLWKFNESNWAQLKQWLPDVSGKIDALSANIKEVTTFLCYNIAETPKYMISNAWSAKNYGLIAAAIFIPVFAGFTQYLSVKLMPQPQTDPENQMANSMKSMNIVMPIFSMWICYTLPIGLGLYWIMAAVIRCIQQIGINKYMNSIPIETLIEKNRAKAEKKRAKKGLPASEKIRSKAEQYTKNIEAQEESRKANTLGNRANSAAKNIDVDYTASNKAPKAGSLAAKANMVRDFNERNSNK